MALEFKEDQTAPVSELQVQEAKISGINKQRTIDKILKSLNEKRDSYNGITSSIIYVIDSLDTFMIDCLMKGLIHSITEEEMTYGGKMFLSKALYRLTMERPLFVEELFETIIKTSESRSLAEETDTLRVQILAIKAIRRAEQSRGGRPTSLSPDEIDAFCHKAIYCCDDQTKIDTLSMVLESRITTKPLDDRELNYFKVLCQDALSLQDPALRQIFIALTNKLIKRICDSHRVIARDRKKYSQVESEIFTIRYMNFLEWLVMFCLDSIYCNAYFGSFILTISTLHLIIEHITFSNKNLPISHLFNNKRCYDSILGCLNDSFEENKKLALDLLLRLPQNDEFISEKNIKLFDEIAYSLVESVNPAHSLTCQYIFKLSIGLKKKQEGCKLTKNQMLLEQLTNLVDIVEEGVKQTQEDFVVALKQKPVYPKLTCIRALLDYVDVNEIEKDRHDWEVLARRILNSSIEACKAVSTIVCNLNPETIGHLPMDLKEVDVNTLTKTLNVSLKISNSKLNTVTSQMLLISGWKTIKECSLSLGSLCTRFWWPANLIKLKREKFPGLKVDPILNQNDIKNIISFFDHYLRNLRHRGAFEQAYNGFIMVTKRIWYEDHFKTLLIEALEQIMNDFKSDALDEQKAETLKAYVTRRSAGLPFIVQAILNSEHKHDSKTLRWVMDSLFEVLESENSEIYQRIHCLNILRALIKEHCLGEKVLSYVGKTFAITMESFKSDIFPIRNCANMLLKATVDRAFGVNRLRDDIHRRNQLSFERFFKECPDLHAKMLKHLTDSISDRRCLTAVHAVVIVLFRLRPTLNPNEESSADKIIEPFIAPLIQITYLCPDYKLRELSACLAVKLSVYCKSHRDKSSPALDLMSRLRAISQRPRNKEDANKIHGEIMLAKHWLLEIDPELETSTELINFSREFADCFFATAQRDESSSLLFAVLDLLETGSMINKCEIPKAVQIYPDLAKILDDEGICKPHSEALLFKTLSFSLYNQLCNLAYNSKKIDPLVQTLQVITRTPNRAVSTNLQAALVRLIRQLCSSSNKKEFTDKLLEKLDIDLTATHLTPFDLLNSRLENDCEKERLFNYCMTLKHYALKSKELRSDKLNKLFEFYNYREFQEIALDGNKFSSKSSNTPRAIELLAFACKNWHQFSLEKTGIFRKDPLKETGSCTCANAKQALCFLIDFTSSLPDSDILCLSLLYAGHLNAYLISHLNKCTESNLGATLDTLANFNNILDQLVEGDRSFATRETIAEVLRLSLDGFHELNFRALTPSVTDLFSALIKLSQDEEQEIRRTSQKVMMSLRGNYSVDLESEPRQYNGLYFLIRFVTTKLFNPSDVNDIVKCSELMMKIIFSDSRTFNELTEEKEQLFDKTKLNTFADHVATVESALTGLRAFFLNRKATKLDINLLMIHKEALAALTTVDSPSKYDTGDYSWRHKITVACKETSDYHVDNNSTVDKVLANILRSLAYFKYWNMLTDTEYTYHELSLYKRVAFVKFVIECTKYELKNEHLLPTIQRGLEEMLQSGCSTTLLHKCLKIVTNLNMSTEQQ